MKSAFLITHNDIRIVLFKNVRCSVTHYNSGTSQLLLKNQHCFPRLYADRQFFKQRRSPACIVFGVRKRLSWQCTITINKETSDTALVEGIRLVSIGKLGSKDLPMDLVKQIEQELHSIEQNMRNQAETAHEYNKYQQQVLQRAAFLGALYMKPKLTTAEQELLRKYELGLWDDNVEKPCSQASLLLAVHPNSFQRLEEFHLTEPIVKLLSNRPLTTFEATAIGTFVLEAKTLTDACLAAMILHVMRVRHETSDELIGFAEACRKTLSTKAIQSSYDSQTDNTRRTLPTVIQITDPFDGVVKSPMITPLLGKYLCSRYGVWTVLVGGETSGPKYGINTKMLVEHLGIERVPRIRNRKDFVEMMEHSRSPSVVYLDLKDICPSLSSLTYLRRTIIKRPCFATVEKVVNYINADILLTSAFHPSYVEKMLHVAAAQHFPQAYVVSGGMEGGFSYPIQKRRGLSVTSFSNEESDLRSLKFISKKLEPQSILNSDMEPLISSYADSAEWLSRSAQLIEQAWDQTDLLHCNSGCSTFDAIIGATLKSVSCALEENSTVFKAKKVFHK